VFDQGNIAKRHGKIYQASPVAARAAIDGKGNVYFGDLSQDGVLHCLAPDCTLKWKRKTFYEIWRSPVIDRENNAILASDDQQVWNFGAAEGAANPLLKIPGDSWAQSISPTLARDGSIFLGCTNDSFFALSREGDTLWDFMPLSAEGEPAGITFSSSAILGDGRVFFGTESGLLINFDILQGLTDFIQGRSGPTRVAQALAVGWPRGIKIQGDPGLDHEEEAAFSSKKHPAIT
jgi:outer membrane protein assembly factor BamB